MKLYSCAALRRGNSDPCQPLIIINQFFAHSIHFGLSATSLVTDPCTYLLIFRDSNPAIVFPTPYRQLHRAYLVFYNLFLLIFPSSLCAEYPLSTITPISSLTDYRNVFTLLTFLFIFHFGFLAVTFPHGPSKTRRPLILAVCLMVFPFLPASNLFFPVGFVIAERVLYLPSMGYCLLVALGAWRLHKLYPTAIKVGVVYLLVIHSVKTLVRNRDWYSSKTVYQSAVVTFPNNGKMWNNLATMTDLDGNKTMAIQLFRHSIKLEPKFIKGYNNLAFNLRELGNMTEALQVSI